MVCYRRSRGLLGNCRVDLGSVGFIAPPWHLRLSRDFPPMRIGMDGPQRRELQMPLRGQASQPAQRDSHTASTCCPSFAPCHWLIGGERDLFYVCERNFARPLKSAAHLIRVSHPNRDGPHTASYLLLFTFATLVFIIPYRWI